MTDSPDELEQKWDILRRKVTNAQAQMPDGARPSVVMDDFGDVYGMFYAITTDGVGDEQLLDYAQLVKRELQDIEGVRRVEIYGNRTPCINIEMMQDKMANLGVHPMEVLSTLNSQNKTVYPGYFNSGDQRLRVAINDSYKSIDDIKNLIIQGHEDDQLRLRDIASITEGYEDPARNGMKYDGKQAFGDFHGKRWEYYNLGREGRPRVTAVKRIPDSGGSRFSESIFSAGSSEGGH